MDVVIVLLPRLVYMELYFCPGAEHPDALCRATWEPWRFKRGIPWGLQAEAANGAEMKPLGLAARCPFAPSPVRGAVSRSRHHGTAGCAPGIAGTGQRHRGLGKPGCAPGAPILPWPWGTSEGEEGRKAGQSRGGRALPAGLQI